MQKTYNVIFLNNQGYMIDKDVKKVINDIVIETNHETRLQDWMTIGDEFVAILANEQNLPKVVATTNKTLGLPILPPIEIKPTEEIKIIKTIKAVFVNGQMFDIAALFRDAEKKAWERAEKANPQPIAVIIEMELVDDYDFSDYEEGGTHPGVTTSQYVPKIDENNQIIVKSWVYE